VRVSAFEEEVIVPLPGHVTPARHARSTVLIGSVSSIRELGRFDEYLSHLPLAHQETLLGAVAGTWIAIDVALAHYEACDALHFSVDQQVQNGRVTFEKNRGTILGTIVKLAREGGVSPWNVLPLFQRFWDRSYDGGGVRVVKLGPKEARLELVAVRIVDSRYYRNALRGLVMGVTELFCNKAYVTETPGKRGPGTVSYRLQWA
jgi:hypothetical protein